MSAERFFDTNVAFYALTDDPIRAPIARRAIELGGTISVQVLNELTLALRRKAAQSWQAIDRHLEALAPFFLSVRPMLLSTHQLGREIAARHQLQFYDSLLLAAAIEARCDIFISEDMKDGLTIGGLTIVNPFGAAGA